MKDKLFRRILFSLIAIGLVATVALAVYTVYSYLNASIVAFIANEWWY